MKNMFPIQFILLAVVVSLLTGCAASRPVGDAALGAGGAYAGYELSGGSSLAGNPADGSGQY